MPDKIECHWEQVRFQEQESPGERSSHGLSEINGVIYIFGGEDASKSPADSSVYAFDIFNQNLYNGLAAWRKIESVENSPIPRVAHAQTVIGNRIYIFGGQSVGTHSEQSKQSLLNDLYYFDVKTEVWTEVLAKGKNVPSRRSFHQMASVGSSLFVFGGCGVNDRMSDLHEFDTHSLTWKKHSNVSSTAYLISYD